MSPDRVRMRWRSNHHRNEAEGERGANDEGRTNENQVRTIEYERLDTVLAAHTRHSSIYVFRALGQSSSFLSSR